MKIIKGISEKKDGNMKIVGESIVTINNRRNFLQKEGFDSNNLVMASLDHGNKVIVVSEKDKGKIHNGYDGLVTNETDLILGVTAADCLPIYFWNEQKTVIGIAHAGWRGVKSEIVKEMIQIFVEKFSCDTRDIYVEVGPHIKDCHFEVRGDLVKAFSEFLDCFRKSDDSAKIFIDLGKIVQRQLIKIGLGINNIKISTECTYCNDKYFSYRRDKPTDIEAVIAYITLVNE